MISKIKTLISKENVWTIILGGFVLFFIFVPLEKIFPLPIVIFIKVNRNLLLTILGLYFIVYFIHYILYRRSLNALFENETEETNRAIWIGNILVITFWICWTILSVYIVKKFPIKDESVYIFSFSLILLSSITTFYSSYDLRKEDIKQNIEIHGANYFEKDDIYTLNTKWHHYSGYFALFSIPLYLILSLIFLT